MLFCYAQQRNYDYASNVLNVPIKRLDPTLPLPKYAQPGDAGCDLIAAEQTVLQPSGGRALIGTGIAIAVDAKGVVDISACSWSEQRDDGSAEGEGSGGEGVEGHDGEVIVESAC